MGSYPFAFLFASSADSAAVPLAMLIVFASAKILAEVFEKLGQPGIVGEIIAGVAVGPSALNWVQPTDFLHALAELGVMFLLFRVGLEVNIADLLSVGKQALAAAVLGVIAPFIAGWGILLLWGEPATEALFVGAAMVATSVGITARVLAAKGLLDHTASRVILAAALIDDVLGLIILAVVSSVAAGDVRILDLLSAAALAIGFTLVVALWGAKAMKKVVPTLDSNMRAGEVQFNMAMVLLFGLFVVAVQFGIAGIIGAFLAGMALAPAVNHRVHDLAQGVTELLVPFFLAGIGIQLQLKVFLEPATLILAVVVLLAAILSKLFGCGLGALSLGRANAFRVGAGMVPRGEVGMVVAQLGLAAGIVSQQIYAVVVFMAVFTTLAAPPLLNAAYKNAAPDAG